MIRYAPNRIAELGIGMPCREAAEETAGIAGGVFRWKDCVGLPGLALVSMMSRVYEAFRVCLHDHNNTVNLHVGMCT